MYEEVRRRFFSPQLLCALIFGATLLVGCEEEGTAELAILDIQPREGAMQGHQPVDIRGVGFRRDMGYTVYFGAQAAESLIIVNNQQMRVSTPQSDTPKRWMS